MIVYKSLNEMRAVSNGKVGYFKLDETKGKNYFKLHDLVKSPQTKLIQTTAKAYQYVTIQPEKHYKLLDDAMMAQISEKFKEKRKYSDALKKTLADAGIEYKEVLCKTCGGKVKKLEYKTVEVVHGLNQRKRKENDPPEDSKE